MRRLYILYFAIFQVEDVNKKFDALKEAESRGWVEEHKPPPRQRKAVKVKILYSRARAIQRHQGLRKYVHLYNVHGDVANEVLQLG